MAIPRGGRRSAEEEPELSVSELLEELREARRVQGELVAVLHHDGEARTRRSDAGLAERMASAAVPLVVGLLLGASASYGGVIGRIVKLETEADAFRNEARAGISQLRNDQQETLRTLREVRDAVNALTTRR